MSIHVTLNQDGIMNPQEHVYRGDQYLMSIGTESNRDYLYIHQKDDKDIVHPVGIYAPGAWASVRIMDDVSASGGNVQITYKPVKLT